MKNHVWIIEYWDPNIGEWENERTSYYITRLDAIAEIRYRRDAYLDPLKYRIRKYVSEE